MIRGPGLNRVPKEPGVAESDEAIFNNHTYQLKYRGCYYLAREHPKW